MAVPVGPGRFAVLDFETTSLDPGPHGRVLEVGVVTLEAVASGDSLDFRVTGEWETLVNPGPETGVGATHVHRIEPAFVASAPSFPEITGDLLTRLDATIVIAHNAAFDLRFLDFECVLAGNPIPRLASVCTRDLARGVAAASGENTTSFRLHECLERAGIPFPEADQHRALGDARVTAALFVHLMQRAHEHGLEVRTVVPRQPLDAPPPRGAVVLRPDAVLPPGAQDTRSGAPANDLGFA